MVNLLISRVCNLRCPYCFAEPYLSGGQARTEATFISFDTFAARLDFLERSGVNEVRLIGGEPTLHPQFPDLIQQAAARGKHIVVFSHGLMPERAVSSLEALLLGQCTVLVNTNAARRSGGPTTVEQEHRRAVMRRLGARAFPGFTIYSPACSLDDLLPLVLNTGCRKVIRLGLAAPTFGAHNVYLHPKQYPAVSGKITRLAQQAAALDIRLEFDCGFVRCMFSDEDLAVLQAARADIGWHCGPVLDVDTDGMAVHCFPLSDKAAIPVEESSEAASLRQVLTDQLRPFRAVGVYPACSACRFKQEGVCSGGCLAATIRRFRQGASTVPLRPDVALNTPSMI